jgi:hypothetical protein
MTIINSLSELGLNESKFPIFFHDSYLNHERITSQGSVIILYVDIDIKGIIVFKTTRLKIITKGQYLFTPRDFNGNELSTENEQQILNKFHDYIELNKLVDIILPPSHYSTFKSIPSKCLFFEMGLISCKIESEGKSILEKMKPNYRNEIRKILENPDIKLESSNEIIQEAYKLFKSTHENQDLFFDGQETFESNVHNLSLNNFLLCCRVKNKLIGAVFFLFDNSKAYYIYSGNEKSASFPGINKLLIYNSIIHFQSIGISEVILGGYRDEKLANKKIIGIQQFKMRFGSEVNRGYHFIKIVNPNRYRFFQLLLKFKSILTGKQSSLINLSGVEIKKSE